MEILTDPPARADWEGWTALAPLEQSWIYGAAAEALGARVLRVRIAEEERIAGVVQLILRGPPGLSVGWSGRGVHWLGPTRRGAERALRRGLPGLRLLLLGGEAGLRLGRSRREARVPLDRDLRGAMHGKWRAALNHGERQGLVVLRERGCPAWLERAEARQRRARGYRGLPPAWRRALARVAPGHVETWGAYRAGVPLAGIVTIRHGAVLTYHAGWSGVDGRRRSAHNLLLGRAMEAARADGALAADLGVVDAANQPGLARFKMRAGAEPACLAPAALDPVAGGGQAAFMPARRRSIASGGRRFSCTKKPSRSKWL